MFDEADPVPPPPGMVEAGADPDAVAAELVQAGPRPDIASCVGLLDLDRLSAAGGSTC